MLYLGLLTLLALLASPTLSSPISPQDVATTSASSPLTKRETNVLSIIFSTDTRLRPVNDPEITYRFYTTSYGKNAVCLPRAETPLKTITSGEVLLKDQAAWKRIGGEHYIKPYGLDCKYMNNGGDAGALYCKEQGDYKLTAGCHVDPEMHRTLTQCFDPTGDGRQQMAVAACEWAA